MSDIEKASHRASHDETKQSDTDTTEKAADAVVLQQLAVDGEALAFDRHGHALIKTDKKAEARLRRKIDWHILPVVFSLYVSRRRCSFLG